MPTPDRYSSEAPAECDVAIVGGGFSGLMSLVRLAQCAPKCQCVVFERRPLRRASRTARATPSIS